MKLTHGSLFSGIGDDYASGMTQTEIGRKYGVSQEVVWRLMRNLGIKARTPSKRNQRGSNNSSWKGGGAKYEALHIRVEVERGSPRKCEVCDTETAKCYDWANLTGNYVDVNDYKRMCRSCHAKHDNKAANFKGKR